NPHVIRSKLEGFAPNGQGVVVSGVAIVEHAKLAQGRPIVRAELNRSLVQLFGFRQSDLRGANFRQSEISRAAQRIKVASAFQLSDRLVVLATGGKRHAQSGMRRG